MRTAVTQQAARRPSWLRKGAILVMTASTFSFAGVAQATTGALELVHPPRVIVPYSRALQFEGRFVLEQVGSGANISSGGMKIEFSEGSVPKFLIGAAQFYQYTEGGSLETALFTLYPFRETADGVTAEILKKGVGGPGRTPILGTLELEKPRPDMLMEGSSNCTARGPSRSSSGSCGKTRATPNRRPPGSCAKPRGWNRGGAPTRPRPRANTS